MPSSELCLYPLVPPFSVLTVHSRRFSTCWLQKMLTLAGGSFLFSGSFLFTARRALKNMISFQLIHQKSPDCLGLDHLGLLARP